MASQAAFTDPLAKFTGEYSAGLSETKQPSPICALARDCVGRYQDLYDILRVTTQYQAAHNSFDRDAVLEAIQDARPRFKAWATNIAALQEIHLKSSLDFRLQEATELRQRVLKILEDLKESLVDAFSIVTGTRANETWEVGELSDFEVDGVDEENSPAENVIQTSELAELLSAVRTASSSLMDISMVIRNTPTRDDYLKAAARYSLDPQWDIGHVYEKFGSAKRSSDWLIQRLGKSITRRRQYLMYRKEHHGKLSRDWSKLVDGKVDEEELDKTIALTQATLFIEAKASAQKDGSEVGSFGSQTSYEQTIVGESDRNRLTVPGPPIQAFEGVLFEFGKPFQCPYCYTEQCVKTRNAWKKHVFRDLRPYVCTFTACSIRMFRSRNEWFAHELQNHRREWRCPLCSMSCFAKSRFKTHIQSHNPTLAGSELEALILQSEEPLDRFPISACSFCDDWEKELIDPKQNQRRAFLNGEKDLEPYGTISQFRRHLGRHMEQLALFALPRNDGDELDDGTDEELADDASHDSSESGIGIPENELVSDNQDFETRPLSRGLDPAHDDFQARNKVDKVKNSPESVKTSPVELRFNNTVQLEKEEILRNHAMEIGDLRKKIDVLTDRIQRLGTSTTPIPTSSDFSVNQSSINNSLTIEEIIREHTLETGDLRQKISVLVDQARQLESAHMEEKKRKHKKAVLELLRKEEEEEEELEREEAIKKYKLEEADRAAKAEKEKDEIEKEYQQRLEEDLRKSGLDPKQIAMILRKGKEKDKAGTAEAERPTYTRMSRRHLSIETLNRYRIDYEIDHDPDYLLIKRWVPEYEQDFLWSHTREVRERRMSVPAVPSVGGKKNYNDEGESGPEFAFVQKKKPERKPSPALLNFLGRKR